jgi:hypothetical protein
MASYVDDASGRNRMARCTRIEIEGGLYHLITRGNGRKNVFHSREDHDKFLQILIAQKHSLPFYLYAYCLRKKVWGQPDMCDTLDDENRALMCPDLAKVVRSISVFSEHACNIAICTQQSSLV